MSEQTAPPAPDAVLTPGASDTLAPAPPMTVEQAQAKKAALFGTAGFAQRVLAGDPDATKQWKEVTAALSPKVELQTTQKTRDYAARMSGLSILKAKADLPDEVWDHVAAGGPVSPAEKEKAIFAKERLFKDKAWVKRYFDGDREANSTMTNINLILASKIGTFDRLRPSKKRRQND